MARNNSVLIYSVNGKPGPNDWHGKVYNTQFDSSASIGIAPGTHRLDIGCMYRSSVVPPKYDVSMRNIKVSVKSNEVITLQWQEQLDLAAQGGDAHMIGTSSCSILVKSSSGKKTLLRDEGRDDDLATANDE